MLLRHRRMLEQSASRTRLEAEIQSAGLSLSETSLVSARRGESGTRLPLRLRRPWRSGGPRTGGPRPSMADLTVIGGSVPSTSTCCSRCRGQPCTSPHSLRRSRLSRSGWARSPAPSAPPCWPRRVQHHRSTDVARVCCGRGESWGEVDSGRVARARRSAVGVFACIASQALARSGFHGNAR